TTRPTVGLDDPGPAQLGEDVLEEVLWDVLRRRDLAGAEARTHGRRGELDHCPHGVVRLGRDPHGVPIPPSAGAPTCTRTRESLSCSSSYCTIPSPRGPCTAPCTGHP